MSPAPTSIKGKLTVQLILKLRPKLMINLRRAYVALRWLGKFWSMEGAMSTRWEMVDIL